MRVSDFDYDLPKELIAQEPLSERDRSRMLVLQRGHGQILHSSFCQLVEHLHPGDCLVLNDTKVIPARLLGKRSKTGGKVELLLLEPAEDSTRDDDGNLWIALTQSRSRPEDGETVEIDGDRLSAQIEGSSYDGTRLVRFDCSPQELDGLLESYGQPPLPPYIRRDPSADDVDRYQTVYARQKGAVAAPTAGLHFTPDILETLRNKGVTLTTLTLHVGLGTFRPVKVLDVEDHQMHSERFELPPECAKAVNQARREKNRVVAVGTTVVRVLESCADDRGNLTPRSGRTDLFIYPGHRLKVVDALLTNFHLPRSTLLMLVCTLGGSDLVLEAYRQAVADKYRFYSYGDCMLLLP